MKVEKKDLIITDPCYISKDDDWGEVFDWDTFIIKDSYFSQYEWVDTGYGDGSPEVFSIPSYYDPSDYIEKLKECEEDEVVMDNLLSLRENIGNCGVDSGTFGVFILEEALKYNPDFLESLPKRCYCIIRNFTGTICPEYDSEENTHFIFKPDNQKERPILTD